MKNIKDQTKNTFPLELLSQSAEERIDYFYNYIAKHPHLLEADETLTRAINTRIKDSIIFVMGPTGVGKSTLCERVEQHLLKETISSEPSPEGIQRTGALRVEADAPETGSFNWKEFYKLSFATLEEPFAYPEETPLPPINSRLIHALAYNNRLPYCEFRVSLEHALRFRRPKVFFIDEAQHLKKMTSGRRLQDQMDVIKSLAKKSKTSIVLVGTYELRSLCNLSGQLSRRAINVHFKRYGTSPEDIKSFQSALWSFQKHLPLIIEPDLMKSWEYCYVHSIGCIGILKDWLTRALEEALKENASTITIKMLQRHALSVEQCENIAAEAIEGEAMLSSDKVTSVRLMRLLGFTKRGQRATMPQGNSVEQDTVKHRPRLPHLVGRRKARRDKVGRG